MPKSLLIPVFILICIALLSGCGDDDASEASNPDPAAPHMTSNTATVPEPVANEPLRLDLSGPLTSGAIKLRWAVWGSKGAWVDTTNAVRSSLADNGTYSCAGPRLVKAFGDPGPKYANTLLMLVDTPGGPIRVGLHNRSMFQYRIVPENAVPPGRGWDADDTHRANKYLVDRAEGNHLVWARWGVGSKWAQAYSALEGYVDKELRVTHRPSGYPLNDPDPSRGKELVVLVSAGGDAIRMHLVNGAYFELNPSPAALVNPSTNATLD